VQEVRRHAVRRSAAPVNQIFLFISLLVSELVGLNRLAVGDARP
jgi:hypothetical protein